MGSTQKDKSRKNQKNIRTKAGQVRPKGIPDGIFALLDEQGAYQFISGSSEAILGYEPSTIVGLDAGDLVHPDDRQEFNQYLTDPAKKITPQASFRFRHAKGHHIQLHLVECSTRENGLSKRFLLRCRHITGRCSTKESLKTPEKRLMNIINFLPDATLAINLKGEVIAWNRAMEEMTGVKAEHMLGMKDYEYVVPFCGYRRPILIDYVLHPDPKGEARLAASREKDDLLIHELYVPYMNESTCLWCKASPLYDSAGNIIGAIEAIRDITEMKQREEDLRIKALELNDLNTTLKVLLKQGDKDRNEFEDRILSNIKLLIEPFLERLKHHADATGKSYLKIIKSNLDDIISPFAHKLSANHLNLTNKEIQVASLIKEGKSTKEIAGIINISESAVNVYRHHLRRKLGLTKIQNLHSYLSSFFSN